MLDPRKKGISFPKHQTKKVGTTTYIMTKHAYKRFRQRISKSMPKKDVMDYAIGRFDNPGYVWIEDKDYPNTYWLITVYRKSKAERQTRAGNFYRQYEN